MSISGANKSHQNEQLTAATGSLAFGLVPVGTMTLILRPEVRSATRSCPDTLELTVLALGGTCARPFACGYSLKKLADLWRSTVGHRWRGQGLLEALIPNGGRIDYPAIRRHGHRSLKSQISDPVTKEVYC